LIYIVLTDIYFLFLVRKEKVHLCKHFYWPSFLQPPLDLQVKPQIQSMRGKIHENLGILWSINQLVMSPMLRVHSEPLTSINSAFVKGQKIHYNNNSYESYNSCDNRLYWKGKAAMESEHEIFSKVKTVSSKVSVADTTRIVKSVASRWYRTLFDFPNFFIKKHDSFGSITVTPSVS